ncbi:MAG: toprim domain-containing protein, partial [Gemmatimonadota bacterium]|nr:toprim domain-containing protein [Gemmatimonadota bacterium]
GERARSYLDGRGLSLEEARTYRLGWAPGGWRALRSAALEQGIDDDTLLDVGLVARSERAEEPYDRFRERLMFTIEDLRERPIGFGGRILDPDSDAPKYLNSPESPVFHKGEELYGLSWARHEIRRGGFAAIVEGFTDVIAMHRAGLRFAVAGLGTSFTREQAARLARYADRAFLLYDSDRAGLRATFRTGDILLGAGIHPRVVTLPEGEDPDSLVRAEGAEGLRRLLDDAVDVLERKLQILRREGFLERIEGRLRAVDGLLSTLRAATDPALRDIYLDRAAEGVGVRRETLVHEIARAPRPGLTGRRRREAAREELRGSAEAGAPSGSAATAEHELALLLVRDPTLVRRALRLGLESRHVNDPRVREIFTALERAADEGEDGTDWSGLSTGARDLVARLLEDGEDLGDPDEVFEAAARKLFFRGHRERLSEIDRELELADSDQQRRLLSEKQQLAAELREAGEATTFIPGARGLTVLTDRSGKTPSGPSQ